MLKPVPERRGEAIYLYINAISAHEFGHTFGLSDFYKDTTGLKGTYALMDNSTKYPVQDEDKEQLHAIYARHKRHTLQ